MKKLRRILLNKNLLRIGLPMVILSLCLATYFLATANARKAAESDISRQAAETLNVQTEAILSQLDKFRYLPRVIALQSFAAQFARNPDRVDFRINARTQLQNILGYSGALEIAIIDTDGKPLITVGANLIDDISGTELVNAPKQNRLGRGALADGDKNRAYAFSSRISDVGGLRGIVVVVASLEAIERSWALSGKPVFASDEFGHVVAKDFQTEEFASSVIDSPETLLGASNELLRSRTGGLYKKFQRPIEIIGWRLNVLEKWERVKTAERSAGLISVLTSALIGILSWLLFSRMQNRLIKDRQEKANAIRLERKVAERTKELVAANRKLATEITEREQAEAALVKAQKELIQAGKLAGLGQMSAALSHEFNQPLAAIRSYADNASQYLAKKRVGEADENIKHIVELTARMSAISKHLRNFARRPEEKTSPVSLPAVIHDAVELISAKLKASNAEIEVDIEENLPMVQAGHTRLQQVLVNLLSNAIDAKSPNRQLKICLSARTADDKVCLTVEDNGSGFSSDVIEQIFDPFFTTKGVNQGLGLGMSISYNIIKDFGGNIVVSNNQSGGASVTVTLLPETRLRKAAG